MAEQIICTIGCCPGCQDCWGMSIGCHQNPCRCDRPCTCRWADEDTDPKWRDGCNRHDDRTDGRRWRDVEPEELEYVTISDPCPECGQVGPCAYDVEGRPMIHTLEGNTDG